MSTCLVCGKEGYHPHGVPPVAACRHIDLTCDDCGSKVYRLAGEEGSRPTPEPAPPCLVCEGWGAYCDEHRPIEWDRETESGVFVPEPAPAHKDCNCVNCESGPFFGPHPWERAAPADLPSVQPINIVVLMENEGVVEWADNDHRQRFLDFLARLRGELG